MADRQLQVKEKQQVATAAEQTKPGPVFTPAVDIYETEREIVLLADMPGVQSDQFDIDLREDTLTLAGEVLRPESKDEQAVLAEYEVGKYYRQFTLSEVIDQAGIEAKLDSGVLKLILPKVEKAKPRKINVMAA